jgi:hypothetical protein
LLLAAAGNSLTDDVSINHALKAQNVAVYAGDSIQFSDTSSISSPVASLFVSSNYDSTTGLVTAGTQVGTMTLANMSGISALNIELPGIGKVKDGRIHEFSQKGMIYMDNYINAILPTTEATLLINQVGATGFIFNAFDNQVSPQNSGKIEIQKKK